jgi:hypothetical protein
MPSVEQEVKQQFAKVFIRQDWLLFKQMADYYFKTAVFLKTADVQLPAALRLLARNCQKRLFIGIGTELLLKALYLRHGYSINLLADGQQGAPSFPFTFQEAATLVQLDDRTYMLNDLIQQLGHVPVVGQLGPLNRGLRIAKVFRNKEGHVVLSRHSFDRTNYDDVEATLVALYARGFGEILKVRFSLRAGEKGLWAIR